jgi:hypothetical protein
MLETLDFDSKTTFGRVNSRHVRDRMLRNSFQYHFTTFLSDRGFAAPRIFNLEG